MGGRIFQGLSGAFIMPASLALVKAYWDGASRQRAVSLWSIGSWGGSGFAALFGSLMAENGGWRWIFFVAAAISLLGMFMVAGTPESKAPAEEGYRFDLTGVLSFMVFMVAVQVFVTQGGNMGWMSLPSLALLVAAIIFAELFFRIETDNSNAIVDFSLFRNMTYTGPTISNFLLNATAGILIVAMTLAQRGGDMSAQEAGFLTIGYAITIVAFIRVGEKLLQTIVSRNVSPHNSAVVTVGAFESGKAGNVIANSAILRLSIRTTTAADREMVLNKVREMTRTQAVVARMRFAKGCRARCS